MRTLQDLIRDWRQLAAFDQGKGYKRCADDLEAVVTEFLNSPFALALASLSEDPGDDTPPPYSED